MKGADDREKNGDFFILLATLFSLLAFSVTAKSKEYSWYCAHVKGHVQPTLGREFSFLNECAAYYIDRGHSSPDDREKVIYLTFDVGYENGNVARVMDALRDEGVTAAFFILGNVIEKNEALVRRMAEEGHTVCNHTLRHKNMSLFEDAAFLEELRSLETLYEERLGVKMSSYYRPPEGRFSRENLLCAARNGYKTIFWSFAYPDWDNDRQPSAEKAKQMILENAHNGAVMLLHPTSATNAEILTEVLRALKSEGYRFGTLDELTREGA